MRLYFHPVSTTSRPVVWFAADNNIQLEYQLVDLFKGEQKEPAFSAINPCQAVPVLEDGAFRLTECSAILKYLAESIDSPAYPRDPQQRARINERMDWFNTSLSRELNYGFVYPQLLPEYQREEHLQRDFLAFGRQNALRWLGVLNDSLLGAHNRYVCGSEVSIADYMGVAYITLGEAAQQDFSRWEHVADWIARMKNRPSWSTTNESFYTHFVGAYAQHSFVSL